MNFPHKHRLKADCLFPHFSYFCISVSSDQSIILFDNLMLFLIFNIVEYYSYPGVSIWHFEFFLFLLCGTWSVLYCERRCSSHCLRNCFDFYLLFCKCLLTNHNFSQTNVPPRNCPALFSVCCGWLFSWISLMEVFVNAVCKICCCKISWLWQ